MARLSPGATYENSVFINCPFDPQYRPIFEAIVFTVQDLGFAARCATERDDSGEIRVQKIMQIIAESKYGIHDISRAEINAPELPRFNMPYELGLFIGCRQYGAKKHKEKVALILDSERYRYQKFLSDINGQDIKSHDNDPQKAVQAVRRWLAPSPHRTKQHGATEIWKRYQQFEAHLPAYCADPSVNLTPDELRSSFVEFVQVVKNFIIGLDAQAAKTSAP